MIGDLERRLRSIAGRALRRRPTVVRIVDGPLAGARLRVGRPSPYDGDYEPAFARALLRLTTPGAHVVDAGAHFGYFTVLLARAVGLDGHVFAFEASPENARMVRENLSLNGLEGRVTVECAAVGGRDAASVELFAGRGGASMEWTLSESFATRESAPGPRPEAVATRMVTLDGYFADRPAISLVKLDIEGAEAEALPRAHALLEHVRPTIVLEFHREVGWPAIVALRDAEYRLEDLQGAALSWPEGAADAPYQLVARPAEAD